MDVQEYLSNLSDSELLAKVDEANRDLTNAANDEPNSEWHQSCFAGLMMLCGEASKRRLTLATAH